MKFFKCDQLLKKSLMENFIFCGVTNVSRGTYFMTFPQET